MPIKFLLLIITLSVFGCATAPELPPEEQVKSHGLLIGTINLKNAVGIQLVSSKNKKVFVGTRGGIRNGKYVSAWLKPGFYDIVNFNISNSAFINAVKIPKGSLPQIEIKVGEVFDLNNIILHTSGERRYSIIVKERSALSAAFNLPQILDGAKYISWVVSSPVAQGTLVFGSTGQGLLVDAIVNYGQGTKLGELVQVLPENISHEQAFEQVKPFGLPTTKVVAAGDGSSFFGTALGQVRYKKGGSWRYFDTGFVEAVTAIDVSSLNSITVALESGIILTTKNFGESWKELYRFENGEYILDVRTIKNKLMISAVTVVEGYDRLIISPNKEITPKISVYSLSENVVDVLYEKVFGLINIGTLDFFPPNIESIGDVMFFSIPFVNELVRINSQTKRVSDLVLPKKITGMSVSEDESYVTIWLAQGVFSNAFYSTDFGESWNKLPKPPYLPKHIELKSEGEAYMWSTSGAYEYQEMDVQNRTWSKLAKSPKSCINLLTNYELNEHYCVLPSGSLKTFKAGVWH